MKILIATHGNFASGIKSSLEIIIGPRENITCINAYTSDTPLSQLVIDYMDSVDLNNEKLIVFTDMMGGSVNQYFMSNYDTDKIFLITGVNLPILLELSLSSEELITKDFINDAINNARQQLLLVEKNNQNSKDDFDF